MVGLRIVTQLDQSPLISGGVPFHPPSFLTNRHNSNGKI